SGPKMPIQRRPPVQFGGHLILSLALLIDSSRFPTIRSRFPFAQLVAEVVHFAEGAVTATAQRLEGELLVVFADALMPHQQNGEGSTSCVRHWWFCITTHDNLLFSHVQQ